MKSFLQKIFSISSNREFNLLALEAFRYQATNCPVYKQYIDCLNIDAGAISRIDQIPFLPIEFFKSHKIIWAGAREKIIFTSSGTTGTVASKHFVADLSVYEASFIRGFELFYGDVSDYCILALLPSYLEREGSSLIYMIDRLMTLSTCPDSGFYLHNLEELAEKITRMANGYQKIILLGVTYALLDLAEKFPVQLKNTIVMETGGMKGKRKELVREELHGVLTNKFGVSNIHSEYGMTELLSQAYSRGNGEFFAPPWMKIMIRDVYDPFDYVKTGRAGGINIIDLANIYSCSFIETRDMGKLNLNGCFEVMGRMDNSDIRGCNLLVAE